MGNLPLIIASGNQGKIGEFKKLLDDFPFDLLTQPFGFEIEETGNTFMENARIKAIAVSQATGNLSLADDSGLSVEALGGAPGIYSSRYASSDKKRIEKLLAELKPFSNRKAKFECALCIASGNKGKIKEFKKLLIDFPFNLLTQPVGFEIEETGNTFVENARIKAIAVSEIFPVS